MSPKKRREVKDGLAAIPSHEERFVLATGRHIGEGFDDARLDTLFLALPVSWKGTLGQYTSVKLLILRRPVDLRPTQLAPIREHSERPGSAGVPPAGRSMDRLGRVQLGAPSRTRLVSPRREESSRHATTLASSRSAAQPTQKESVIPPFASFVSCSVATPSI